MNFRGRLLLRKVTESVVRKSFSISSPKSFFLWWYWGYTKEQQGEGEYIGFYPKWVISHRKHTQYIGSKAWISLIKERCWSEWSGKVQQDSLSHISATVYEFLQWVLHLFSYLLKPDIPVFNCSQLTKVDSFEKVKVYPIVENCRCWYVVDISMFTLLNI